MKDLSRQASISQKKASVRRSRILLSPVHPALQVLFAQHATLVVIRPAVSPKAAEVGLHDIFAFAKVVEGEGATLGSGTRD